MLHGRPLLLAGAALLTLLFAARPAAAQDSAVTPRAIETVRLSATSGLGGAVSPVAGDRLGTAVTAIGDLSGNGVTDFAVGAEGVGAHSGAVYVLRMASRTNVQAITRLGASSPAGVIPEALRDELGVDQSFGASVATLGDLSGNGVPDLLVGAPGTREGGSLAGAVYVLFMAADGRATGYARISGADYASGIAPGFGRSVTRVDGIALPLGAEVAVAVGAPGATANGLAAGAVFLLFLDAEGGVVDARELSAFATNTVAPFGFTLGSGDFFGAAVASVGTLGGASVLAVGAPFTDAAGCTGACDRGAVHLVFLGANATATRIETIREGAFAPPLAYADDFGRALAAPGDFDGDGTPDLFVGAPNADGDSDGSGAAYLFLLDTDGSVRAHRRLTASEAGLPPAAGSEFGWSLATAPGPVGLPRLLVGAPGAGDGAAQTGALHALTLAGAPYYAGCYAVTDGGWGVPSTWLGCHGTAPTRRATIPEGVTLTHHVPVGSQAVVDTLFVGGTLNVSHGSFAVSGHLALAGTLARTHENTEVRLLSGPGPDGTRIATFSNEGGTLSGALTYERYYAGPQGWRTLGSPFANVPLTSLNATFHTQGAANATYPNAQPILFTYDPARPAGARWVAVPDYAQTAQSGRGYLFYAFQANIQDGEPDHLPGRWVVGGAEPDTPVAPSLPHLGEGTFHLLANPFAGPLDWAAVLEAASGVDDTFLLWDPTLGSTGAYRSYQASTGLGDAGATIAPFQAFFVATTAASPSLVMTQAMKSIETSPLVVGRPEPPAAPVAITFDVRGEGLVATRPTALFHEAASPGSDAFDARWLAPVSSDHVAATFRPSPGRALLYDARPPADEPVELDLHVTTSRPGAYTLSWPEWRAVPDDWTVELLDRHTNQTVDLRTSSAHPFTLGAARNADSEAGPAPFESADEDEGRSGARFTLRVGPRSVDTDDDAPVRFAFEAPFPNPFAGRATLRFSLPEATPTRLVAYDVMGREVAVLLDEVRPAGTHTVSWSADGLASGLYVVRLTSGSHRASHRLLLVR